MTLKSKEIGRLPEFVVDTSQETLAGLIHMETACKNVMRRPAVLEVTMGDANDLASCSCRSHIHNFLMTSSQHSKRFVARLELFTWTPVGLRTGIEVLGVSRFALYPGVFGQGR